MITQTLNKNKFGGFTWEFKLDSLHHIFINETDNGAYVVEFKEWKFISYKTHFSFVSNGDFKDTICQTFDRIHEFLSGISKYDFSIEEKNLRLFKMLNFIESHKIGAKK